MLFDVLRFMLDSPELCPPILASFGPLLGPLGVLLGPPWDLLGGSLEPLGASLGPPWSLLGPPRAFLGLSWGFLVTPGDLFGSIFPSTSLILADPTWPWRLLGLSLGHSGPLLAPPGPLLGLSEGLLGLSWSLLGLLLLLASPTQPPPKSPETRGGGRSP